MQLKVYSDPLLASNHDHTSRLGLIILHTEKTCRCKILRHSCQKSKLEVRFVYGGEFYASSHTFNATYMLKQNLDKILETNTPLCMIRDFKYLFDVINKWSLTAEQKLKIDISAILQK